MDLALLVVPEFVTSLFQVFLDLWEEHSPSVLGVVSFSSDDQYLKVLSNVLVSPLNRFENHLKQSDSFLKSQEMQIYGSEIFLRAENKENIKSAVLD